MRCNRSPLATAMVTVSAGLALTGCGLMTPDSGPTVDYRDAETARSLEVPPDLTRPASNGALTVDGSGSDGTRTASVGSTAVDGTGGADGVLPEFEDVRFVRAGASSWLEVDQAPPDRIWTRVDRFIRAQGLEVARREPALGIVETDWAKRYDGPESGGLTGLFNNLVDGLTGDNIRDRYRIRLERMETGGTRIFVGHQVAQEIDAEADTRREADYQWIRRGGDPGVEAEMARRLLVYLGVSESRSESVVADAGDPLDGAIRYEVDGGTARLAVADPNPRRVFARVGDALNRIGAEVQSVDNDRSVYVFDWRPPEGTGGDGGFLGLFGGGEPESRRMAVRLRREGDAIRIRGSGEDGRPLGSEVRRALLRELALAMGADEDRIRTAEEGDADEAGESGYQAPEGPPM